MQNKAKAPTLQNRKRGSLDSLDINIINELLDNSNASSTDIAKKFNRPLSTIQRRRTKLERAVLKKDYSIANNRGMWRSGEFFATVGRGRTEVVARQIFDKYPNLTLVSTTVNNIGNLMAHVYFKDSLEMFGILEEIKKIPDVSNVMYAEHIEKVGERKPKFILSDLVRQ